MGKMFDKWREYNLQRAKAAAERLVKLTIVVSEVEDGPEEKYEIVSVWSLIKPWVLEPAKVAELREMFPQFRYSVLEFLG